MTKSINQTLLNCRWCLGFEAGTDKSGNERFPKSNLTLFGGWVPWSSGFGRWLMFERSWVQIPALCTGWTFFTYICCKNCTVCLFEKNCGYEPIFCCCCLAHLKVFNFGRSGFCCRGMKPIWSLKCFVFPTFLVAAGMELLLRQIEKINLNNLTW